MFDQYHNEVPTDLVCMPSIAFLGEDEIKIVDQARWYDVEHPGIGTVLMVSAAAIQDLAEEDLNEVYGLAVEDCDVFAVDDCLHRYSAEDGFYHA